MITLLLYKWRALLIDASNSAHWQEELWRRQNSAWNESLVFILYLFTHVRRKFVILKKFWCHRLLILILIPDLAPMIVSPNNLNISLWERFETLLYDHEIPCSVTFTLLERLMKNRDQFKHFPLSLFIIFIMILI